MKIVVGVTKAVGDCFGKGGIADRMIWFNGFPFLDNKDEHSFGVPISHIMMQDLAAIPSTGLQLHELGREGHKLIEFIMKRLLTKWVSDRILAYGEYVSRFSNCPGPIV